jgi:YVTN family beta-propeller protein
MPKVVVPVKEEILRAAERRKAVGASDGVVEFLAELIDLGFEHRLRQLYQRFEAGEFSLGYYAKELGGVCSATVVQAQFSAYVTNRNSNTVSVLDTATNTVSATVPVGSQPIGVAVSPNGAFVYVANLVSNTVSVIDVATNTVSATVPVGSEPSAFGQFIGPAADLALTKSTPADIVVHIGGVAPLTYTERRGRRKLNDPDDFGHLSRCLDASVV